MRIFNTLTRHKEEFIPVSDKTVNMYVCGPTVYDLFHIGNARTFIFFDTVRRYLEYRGYEVNYVQNFTDIDDKIINKCIAENETITHIGQRYINEYYIDADNLNIKRATVNPRATENIDEMIGLIIKLIDNNFAYVVEGEVYFSVRTFKKYGNLFGQDIDTLKSGSRIKVNDKKRDALDFILWKKSKENEPGYNSPWGLGRPGWHTECCSMIYKYFDRNTIDIHGGGFDLIFPHHENEIAQIEALSDRKLANYWMHCSFLNINDEKMSKSLGNFLTARDILRDYSSSVIRYFILSVHYRTTLLFSYDQIKASKKSLYRINKTYKLLLEFEKKEDLNNEFDIQIIEDYRKRFIDRMDDDFNTADAISIVFEFIKYINKHIDSLGKTDIGKSISIIRDFYDIFGIKECELFEGEVDLPEDVVFLVKERYAFKKNKEYDKADLIRNELESKGFMLEDIKGGTRIVDIETGRVISTIEENSQI